LYLQKDKVLKAAGIDLDIMNLKLKNEKRIKRKHNFNKIVIRKYIANESV
jgi:hypothetical protein